ncbi:hypothetical protein PPL_06521 [Heterostelium album PN500]|uniref:Uncharacterized protein n=1 Tax=Heterostelium pallidum (strain ATCC 26659 / Pp 5 / PN500) TaxID=670386 RepID=D3BDD8_HETP5|nr:hypothetical protein PPL_06521 [Heterostelium album PN500]EFA80582.1 hypothetical protein PPL_06521 [Heterostelium album PN500]|eukprot:XP_020432702.1 hypothetical protein PPL_06521 [Heterostelium album PN500]
MPLLNLIKSNGSTFEWFNSNLKEVEDDNGNIFNQIWVIVDRFSKYALIPTHNTYKSGFV